VTLLRRLEPWAPPLLLMAVIFVLSAQPSLDSGLGVVDRVGRKVVHCAAYALLAALWWRVLRRGAAPPRAALWAFLITSAYAVTDEYHQSFVEGRHGSPIDWGIDTVGAGLAALRLRARGRLRA
jgi:VanZ family protein